jgi:hypothetical protein
MIILAYMTMSTEAQTHNPLDQARQDDRGRIDLRWALGAAVTVAAVGAFVSLGGDNQHEAKLDAGQQDARERAELATYLDGDHARLGEDAQAAANLLLEAHDLGYLSDTTGDPAILTFKMIDAGQVFDVVMPADQTGDGHYVKITENFPRSEVTTTYSWTGEDFSVQVEDGVNTETVALGQEDETIAQANDSDLSPADFAADVDADARDTFDDVLHSQGFGALDELFVFE